MQLFRTPSRTSVSKCRSWTSSVGKERDAVELSQWDGRLSPQKYRSELTNDNVSDAVQGTFRLELS